MSLAKIECPLCKQQHLDFEAAHWPETKSTIRITGWCNECGSSFWHDFPLDAPDVDVSRLDFHARAIDSSIVGVAITHRDSQQTLRYKLDFLGAWNKHALGFHREEDPDWKESVMQAEADASEFVPQIKIDEVSMARHRKHSH